MTITKSQVEKVISLAQEANSFPKKSSLDAAEDLDKLINPVKDEEWRAQQALKEYLLSLGYPQLIELAQLMFFGREWYNHRGNDDFFTSIEDYKNDCRSLADEKVATDYLMGKKNLGAWLIEAIRHDNPDNK